MKKILFLIILFVSGISVAFSFGSFEDIKPKAEVEIKLVPEKISPGASGVIEIYYNIPEGFYQTIQKDYFNFDVISVEGLNILDIIYPLNKKEDEKLNGKILLKRMFILSKDFKAGSFELNVIARYQLCDEKGVCFSPDSVEIKKNISVVSSDNKSGLYDVFKLFNFLLFALIGGLLLNIMPCVLPVISLKVFSLIKQSRENKKSILFGAFFYSAGIIFSMIIMSAAVILFKAAGESVGWGFQFQNPIYVMILFFIIFIFALSMFDIFVINISLNLSGSPAKSVYLDSFGSGILTALLATPCTAPFLGTALGFAFTQSPLVIFLIFIFIGVGLSIPLFVLSLFPGTLKFIPKPGEWMNVFKVFLGFILLFTSVWLLNIFYLQKGWGNTLIVLISAVSITLGLWLYGLSQRNILRNKAGIFIRIISTVIIIVTLIFLFMNMNINKNDLKNTNVSEYKDREMFSEEKFEKYLNENKNIFIIFSAEWCLTCKTNEKLVLNTKEIRDFFISNSISVLYGDFTSYDPVIDKWIKKYGRAGVPFYAVFKAGGSEPLILPEILSKELLKKSILNQAND